MAKKKQQTAPTGPRTVATNRKARHEYFIEETFEAGIALTGTEIKSARNGSVNLREGFVLVRAGEAWLMGVHIDQYRHGNRANHQETRSRKLLLHKRQIDHLHAQALPSATGQSYPLRMYINDAGLAKVQIALVRGKRQYDKRQTIASRDAERDVSRALKQQSRDL